MSPAAPPTEFRPERKVLAAVTLGCVERGWGWGRLCNRGRDSNTASASSVLGELPRACPLSGLRVPSSNMRAWLNKAHKEPPRTFHHWLSFLDTRSWNLGRLLLPDDWLSSWLHLPGHTAKTTATMGFLKKVEWKPDQIQSPIKRTTLSKGADSRSENHIPQVPGWEVRGGSCCFQ